MPKTTQQLLDEAIDQLIADARRQARQRKDTLKNFSKKIFGDTRTLPALIKGKRAISVARIGNAASIIEEMKE